MASVYLRPEDYAAYGVSLSTNAAQATLASRTIDQVLNRPEGLIWVPDATGAPAYMAGLTPSMTFTLDGDLAPGANVSVKIVPAMATLDWLGDVLILDRGSSDTTEACVVSGIIGRDTITFATVRLAHAKGASADQGLLITEERSLPAKRAITRVARIPCTRLVSVQGRYGYGRRSDQVAGLSTDLNLLAAVSQFGAPQWVPVDPDQCSVSPSTGDVYVPAGLLLATYNDVRLRYVAGWSTANVPGALRAATAAILTSVAATADLPGQVKMFKAGDTAIQRFAATNIDPDTMAMLEPFKARVFY